MERVYKLRDGGTITATCAADFVGQLHRGSKFDNQGSDQEYMYRFADRYHDMTGVAVRTDNAEHFLGDLISSGYVSVD